MENNNRVSAFMKHLENCDRITELIQYMKNICNNITHLVMNKQDDKYKFFISDKKIISFVHKNIVHVYVDVNMLNDIRKITNIESLYDNIKLCNDVLNVNLFKNKYKLLHIASSGGEDESEDNFEYNDICEFPDNYIKKQIKIWKKN